MSSTVGVMRAATPHPYLLKMVLERSIMRKVTAPVADEKSPMKEEYSLGLGNWALILLFHVTSTRLILIPYATTCTHSEGSLSSSNKFQKQFACMSQTQPAVLLLTSCKLQDKSNSLCHLYKQ